MLQTVHTGFHCCLNTIVPVSMRHHGHTLFMCNMYHLFHFSRIQRCSRDSSVCIEIHDSCSHDLNKIRTCIYRLKHTTMKFPHCCKAFSNNGTIVSLFVDCKYRSPVINTVFRRKFFRSRGNAQCIATITYKSNISVLISFQMLSYYLVIRTILMHINCLTVIHTIHNYMRMTFSKHCSFPLIYTFYPAIHTPYAETYFITYYLHTDCSAPKLFLKEITDFHLCCLYRPLHKEWLSAAPSI